MGPRDVLCFKVSRLSINLFVLGPETSRLEIVSQQYDAKKNVKNKDADIHRLEK